MSRVTGSRHTFQGHWPTTGHTNIHNIPGVRLESSPFVAGSYGVAIGRDTPKRTSQSQSRLQSLDRPKCPHDRAPRMPQPSCHECGGYGDGGDGHECDGDGDEDDRHQLSLRLATPTPWAPTLLQRTDPASQGSLRVHSSCSSFWHRLDSGRN